MMKTKHYSIALGLIIGLSSCSSKKELTQTKAELQSQTETIADLKKDKAKAEAKIDQFKTELVDYKSQIENLQDDNASKLELREDGSLVSQDTKNKVSRVLKNVAPDKLAQAKNFNDSLNLAISENIKSALMAQLSDESAADAGQYIDVKVSSPSVEINISEPVLYKTGSAFVKLSAYKLLERIALVVNQKQNMMVNVVGHTDNQKVTPNRYIEDNWELSAKRSAAVVRILTDKFDVAPERLTSSGAGEYHPVADNSTDEGKAKNRRVTIKLVPSLKQFMSILD